MIPAVWPSTDLDLDLDLLKAVGMASVPAGHKSVGFGSLHHILPFCIISQQGEWEHQGHCSG